MREGGGCVVRTRGKEKSWARADHRFEQAFMSKFGARGIIRGATLALCAANLVGGGVAYAFGRRKEEPEVR